MEPSEPVVANANRAPTVASPATARSEPEFSSAVNVGPGIAYAIVAIVLGLVGVVLTLSGVWPAGAPLLVTSVVLWLAAGRSIRKNEHEPAPAHRRS